MLESAILNKTIHCEFVSERETKNNGFITLAEVEINIRLIFFSEKGIMYLSGCKFVPISPRMYFNAKTPFLTISNYTDTFTIKLYKETDLLDIIDFICSSNYILAQNTLDDLTIYSKFYDKKVAHQIVSKMKCIDPLHLNYSLDSGKNTITNPHQVYYLHHNNFSDSSTYELRKYENIPIVFLTFNVNLQYPPDNDILTGFFDFENIDIVVIGLQEVTTCGRIWDAAIEKAAKLKKFMKVDSVQLGTCYLGLFSTNSFFNLFRHKGRASISLGPLNIPNKAAVGLSFCLYDTRICIVNSHLKDKPHNIKIRNEQFWTIKENLIFNKSSDNEKILDNQSSIEDHELIFWIGDLNYRIDMHYVEAREFFTDIKRLLKFDQLLYACKHRHSFFGYEEPQISFLPSYKYNYYSDSLDTTKNKSAPAYCDRILYRKNDIGIDVTPKVYSLLKDFKMSDHRPVYGIFDIKIFSNINQNRFQETLSRLDRFSTFYIKVENLVDFEEIRFCEIKTRKVTVENRSLYPLMIYIPCDFPWIILSQSRFLLKGSEKIDIEITIDINYQTQYDLPVINPHIDIFLQVFVLMQEYMTLSYIRIKGFYLVNPLFLPLQYLCRLPSSLATCNSEIFNMNFPDSFHSAKIMIIEPVQIPYEIQVLVDRIRKCQDLSIFSHLKNLDGITEVVELLRNRESIDDIPDLAISDTLHQLLSSLYEPIIDPDQLLSLDMTNFNKTSFIQSIEPTKRVIFEEVILNLLRFFQMQFNQLKSSSTNELVSFSSIITYFSTCLSRKRGYNYEINDKCYGILYRLISL